MQLPSGKPLAVVLVGKFSVSTELRMRSPVDPVSTNTWSMLWHTAVPGTQMVTVVKAEFTFPSSAGRVLGPASTMIG